MPDRSSAGDQGPAGRILVVDDEPDIIESLRALLESARYEIVAAASAKECLAAIDREDCDLVLLDLMLPDRPGLDVLRDLRKVDPTLPVIMLTAYGSIEAAVEATRSGAANFLTKPWNNSQLLLEVEHTLARRTLERENAKLRDELGRRASAERIIRESEAMQRVYALVAQVAPTSSTVLISGESGTGKELVARAIHAGSPRVGRPFVVVNSGSIPAELLESTLFGHLEGSFAGASRDRQGCFELANEGTLLLDEVAALTLETQAKLLRVIQEQEFARVGSNEPIRVDVRIVAATNEDLTAAVQQGRFREDLFYRLNVIGVELPPLRARMADIPLLVAEFLTKFCRREKNHFLDQDGNSTLRFTADAMRILLGHSWPGNVRELRNVIERAVVLATEAELGPEALPGRLASAAGSSESREAVSVEPNPGESLAEMVEDFERRVLLGELKKHAYNQTETAKALRVALSTLNQKIQRLGIKTKHRQSE